MTRPATESLVAPRITHRLHPGRSFECVPSTDEKISVDFTRSSKLHGYYLVYARFGDRKYRWDLATLRPRHVTLASVPTILSKRFPRQQDVSPRDLSKTLMWVWADNTNRRRFYFHLISVIHGSVVVVFVCYRLQLWPSRRKRTTTFADYFIVISASQKGDTIYMKFLDTGKTRLRRLIFIIALLLFPFYHCPVTLFIVQCYVSRSEKFRWSNRITLKSRVANVFYKY